MASKASTTAKERQFAAFLLSYLRRLPPSRRVDALRSTNADWAVLLRRMHAKVAAEGPGLFLDLGQGGPRTARPAARAVVGVGYAFEARWSHPSLGGARLVPQHAESQGERRRWEAERLVVGALRLCDAAAPLDTVTLDLALLTDLDAFWAAMRWLSAGRFGTAPNAPSAAAAASARPEWFRRSGWFSLGAFVAARLHLLLAAAVQAACVPGVQAAPAPPLRRVPEAWWRVRRAAGSSPGLAGCRLHLRDSQVRAPSRDRGWRRRSGGRWWPRS